MGPLLTLSPVFPPPSRVFASRGVLPLSVGTAQKLLLSENLLSSAKLLSRSILFRRRQKRGEPADGLSSRGGGGGGGRGEEGAREDVVVPYRSRYGIPFVFVCRRAPAGKDVVRFADRSRAKCLRQTDRCTLCESNEECTVYFLVCGRARARARSYKTDDSWERLNGKEIALSLVS